MRRIAMFFLISSLIFAKDINVGDLIKFKISGIEKESIVEGFKNSKLQLENIEKSDDGYILSIRGYEVGENTVILGNKKLLFNIESVLTDSDKEIYPHLSDNSDSQLHSKTFPYLLILGGVLGVSSLIYLIKGINFKKNNSISPEKEFENKISNLSEVDWDFQLSMALRKYIDQKYQSHFLSGNYHTIGMIDNEDIAFINNLDIHKFSKEDSESKKEVLDRVMEIYNKIRGDHNV